MFSTFLQWYELFWWISVLGDIVRETNCYATVQDANQDIMGRHEWCDMTVPYLKGFLAIWMYMGMNPQPNFKTY